MAVEFTTEPVLTPWTAAQRESFFAATARHRHAAARVDVASHASALVLALILAILMSPLYYGVLGLALDLVNFFVPMPDLIKTVTDAIGEIIDDPASITLGRGLYLATLAALPGIAVMVLIVRALGRVMREAMTLEASDLAARAPNASVLAEHRFANVVVEMALAAGITQPRVLVADTPSVNAAAFGRDDGHTTIVVTVGLLNVVNRAELQGVSAHLVGSIANGDINIGSRVAVLLGLFGLTAKLSGSFADRGAARRFASLLRSSLRRGSSAADGKLAIALANPFQEQSAQPQPSAMDSSPRDPQKVPWRTIAWMPLVGPLVISGFFGGMVCAFALGPLLALIWRRRKYMADATAVRLTRDPDALAGALQKMRGMSVAGAFSAWTEHMSVVPDTAIRSVSLFSGSSVPMSPRLDRRLKALGVMGAQVGRSAGRRMPRWAWCVLAPLGALLLVLLSMALFLLIYISVALSGLFTWLPIVLIHAILR